MWAGARLSLSPESREREAEKTDSRGTLRASVEAVWTVTTINLIRR